MVKAWFKDGKEDANLSIIKVKPQSAYYWDIEGNKMINFLKIVSSIAIGTTLDLGKQGSIKI